MQPTTPLPENKQRQRRRGSATVELAIVCPLLLLLVFGCLDYGRSLSVVLIVSNATRVGAENGANHRFTDETQQDWIDEIKATINQELASITNYNPQHASITVQTLLDADDVVRVIVQVEYRFQVIVSWPGLPAEIPVRHTVVMRQIR